MGLCAAKTIDANESNKLLYMFHIHCRDESMIMFAVYCHIQLAPIEKFTMLFFQLQQPPL